MDRLRRGPKARALLLAGRQPSSARTREEAALTSTAPAAPRGYESFSPGEAGSLGTIAVERDAVVAFAAAWDPQPFHLDEAAGLASPLKGHAASGWHTCAMLMRTIVDGLLSEAKSMGSGGITDLKWLKPVLVGDRLAASYAVREVRPSGRGDRGYVDTAFAVQNQRGETVLTMNCVIIIGR